MQDPYTVLILPGWLGSGPGHWQSYWESSWGDQRVQQHDWEHPLRGDWIARLESVVLETPGPLLFAAHSLGCHLVAGWSALSRHTDRVLGALLVAPPDLTREDVPAALHSWVGHPPEKLPMRSHLVSSTNDPFCGSAAAASLAVAWGSRHTELGAFGHINASSGLLDWPQGRSWLLELA